MRNKRFAVLTAIVMCFVLVSAMQSSAVTLRYDESEQKWKDLAVQRVPWRSGNDHDNDYYGTNCYCFVDWVLKDEDRGSLSGFCYEAYLNGLDDKKVAQYLNASFGHGPGQGAVFAAFKLAQPGDVVQMRWGSSSGSSNVHTALVNGFNGNEGVYFFQSHVSGPAVKAIKNSYYTYEELSKRFSNPGTDGGFTIYRFESTTPDLIEPKPDINPGLLRLNSSMYAKSFTLTSGKYTGLYSSKELKTRISSTAYTGGTDEDWLLDVDWNSRNVPYARISYPVSGGRKIAYVNLQEVFVKGTLSENAKSAKSGYTGLYIRKNSGRSSSYRIDAGDPVWLLTKEDGWCQVLYPISEGLYRIAWLPESDYNKMIDDDYLESNMQITGSFADGTVGTPYSSKVLVDCTSIIYISQLKMSGAGVSVISGSLPDGLSVSHSGQYIYLTGTPTKADTYNFKLRLKNGYGGYTEKDFTVNIASVSNPPKIYFTFKDSKAGVSYYDYVYVSGGTLPLRATYSGSLPIGLGLSIGGRMIYLRGTPTRAYDFTFTIKVTDAKGLSDSKTFTVNIANNSSYFKSGAGEEVVAPMKPKIATTKLEAVTVGNEFSAVLEASGTKPITWTVIDGELPDGVVMGETGEIIGTPAEAGKYKFKVQAENEVGTATKKYTLKVLPEKPFITTTVLPGGEVDMPYSFRFEAEGEDIKWGKSGKLPKGLKLDKVTGEISGTPTKAGTYDFTIKAKNKAGKDSAEFRIVISDGTETANLSANAAAVKSSAVHHDYADTEELFLLKDGAEIDDAASVSAGMPLTFRAGELHDDDDDETPADFSGLRVFVDGEEAEGVSVSPEGAFTLPGELVQGAFTVYAAGIVDGREVETAEIDIEAEGGSLEEDSSGSCSVNLGGMFMLMIGGIVLLKKK